jgi:3-hydroxyisobutyrate dehydrogenase-like beta-hydroxyacid dehydrogenase
MAPWSQSPMPSTFSACMISMTAAESGSGTPTPWPVSRMFPISLMCRLIRKPGLNLRSIISGALAFSTVLPAKPPLIASYTRFGSPSDVASKTDVVITMLPNSPQVKEVVLGKNGLIEGAKSGSLVVDMSSIAPLAAREVAAELKKKGIRMLDAPVSGGEPQSIDGTLSIMVGGEKADFDTMLPLFKCMGSSAVLTGAVGAGNVTKLANQIIVAINIEAVSEAMVLATKAGVDHGQKRVLRLFQ